MTMLVYQRVDIPPEQLIMLIKEHPSADWLCWRYHGDIINYYIQIQRCWGYKWSFYQQSIRISWVWLTITPKIGCLSKIMTQCHQVCRSISGWPAEEGFRYRSGLLLAGPPAVSHQPGSGFDGAKFDGWGMQAGWSPGGTTKSWLLALMTDGLWESGSSGNWHKP